MWVVCDCHSSTLIFYLGFINLSSVSVNYFIKFFIKIKNKKWLILLIILSIFHKIFFKIGNNFVFLFFTHLLFFSFENEIVDYLKFLFYNFSLGSEMGWALSK